MCAGLAALRQLADGGAYARLEALGARLEARLAGVPGLVLQRVGSVFWMCFADPASPAQGPLRSPARYPEGCAARYKALFHGLLARGIYLAPSGFEVGFLSAAHTEADVDALAAAVHEIAPAFGGK